MQLEEQDLQVIAEAILVITEYKRNTLKSRGWAEYRDVWLPKAVDQIEANEFNVRSADRNFFTWLEDQASWVKLTVPGFPKMPGPAFLDTELGQDLQRVCRRARYGQSYYDRTKQ